MTVMVARPIRLHSEFILFVSWKDYYFMLKQNFPKSGKENGINERLEGKGIDSRILHQVEQNIEWLMPIVNLPERPDDDPGNIEGPNALRNAEEEAVVIDVLLW